MSPVIRIGTRRSKLALAQSGMMQRAIAAAMDLTLEQVPLVEIVTTGDRVQDRRLLEIGGKALFTKEIEEALLDGRVDVAVHSMKDVPAEQPKGLRIAAIPEREDASDAFISHQYASFDDLPAGAASAPPPCGVRPKRSPCAPISTSRCCAAMSTPG